MSALPVKGLSAMPTTIEAALQPSSEARIITEPNEPFRIVHVNEMWCRTCGFGAEEVLGQQCKFLQGPGTCSSTLALLKQGLQLKRALAVQLLNYTKSGRPFMNTLQVAPLYNPAGNVTHYLGVVMARYLDNMPAGSGGPTSQQQLAQQASQSGAQLSAGRQSSNGSFGGGAGHQSAPPTPARGGNLGPGSLPPLGPQGLGGGFSGFGHGGEPGGYGHGHEGGSSGGGGQHNSMLVLAEDASRDDPNSAATSRVPPFLTKLTEILTVESPDVVTLNDETPSFTIADPQRFAKEVLPRYFKHNKLGSFYQQLHTYGFRRAGAAPDSAVEFHHDQYSGSAAEFAEWIRSGGAVSKRTVPTSTGRGEPPPAPPPQLLHDMLQVHEGMRQLAYHFNQAKAMHSVQLRTILQKLTMRGLLAPESAAYISQLPPATPLPTGSLANAGYTGMPQGGMPTALSSAAQSELATQLAGQLGGFGQLSAPGGRALHDSLQAQLDALEAGLLSSSDPNDSVDGPGGSEAAMASDRDGRWGSIDGSVTTNPTFSQDLQGDEALNLFTDTTNYDTRLPQPYPVDAAGILGVSTTGVSTSGAEQMVDS